MSLPPPSSTDGPDGPDSTAPRIADCLAAAAAAGLPRLDAHAMLAHLLQRDRAWLLAHDEQCLLPDQQRTWKDWLRRRTDGEPLAYLTGEKEFHGLALQVNPAVLVPRPDTETLVDWALELLPEGAPARLLDLGTGSGAIVLALALRRPRVRATATDASAAALGVARANGERLGAQVDWRLGPWWAPIAPGELHELIVSNPPYVAEGDPHLPALRHEPIQALTAGPDGLRDLHLLVDGAPAHLAPGGWLLLEHGADQAAAVAQRLTARGFTDVRTRADLAGRPRCTGGRWLHP